MKRFLMIMALAVGGLVSSMALTSTADARPRGYYAPRAAYRGYYAPRYNYGYRGGYYNRGYYNRGYYGPGYGYGGGYYGGSGVYIGNGGVGVRW